MAHLSSNNYNNINRLEFREALSGIMQVRNFIE